METDESSANENAEAELLQKHRRERKELQSKIQSLKHSISKCDKRKKKEIAEEIARLEAELDEKQNNELQNLKDKLQLNRVTHKLQDTVLSSSEINGIVSNQPRISRAKKRKEKKAEKQRERDELIAHEEIENLTSARTLEAKSLNEILEKRNCAVFEIPSDGNCLYKAIEHQLKLQDIETSVQSLRTQVSKYMLSHVDDFIPFLTHPDSGDLFTQEQYEVYCNDIAAKPVWGGHLELQALSCCLQQPIEVIQAEGPAVLLGEHFDSQPLLITYHKYVYGLGEHYNSVIPKSLIDNDEWET